MSHQVNLGTVQVVSGSNVVRHEWRLFMTSVSGGFSVGDSLTWSGGTGLCGGWNAVSNELLVSRTSGSNPAVATVITGPSGSATVSSISAGSPPNWNVSVTLPAVASFASHHATYDVQALFADYFELTTNYLGATSYDHDYGLNTDITTLGLGLVRPGDVGAASIVSRNMTRINTLLTRAACELRFSANLALTNGMDAAITWNVETEDTGGFATVPTTTIVIPSGISRVDFGTALKLTAALSATQVVTARLLKNAVEVSQHSITELGIGAAISRNGISVVTGDTLSVKLAATGSSLPSVLAGSTSNLWCRVAEVV